MTIFTRRIKSVIWHIDRDCSKYPGTGSTVMVSTTKPVDSKVCKECQAKARNDP
jgi:hypothetical protein